MLHELAPSIASPGILSPVVSIFFSIIPIWGFPKIRGTFLGSPNNKDYSILGSILGYLNFGKLPYNHITLIYTL